LAYLNIIFRDGGSIRWLRKVWAFAFEKRSGASSNYHAAGDKEFGREPLVAAQKFGEGHFHLLLLLHCQRTIIMRSLQHLQVTPSIRLENFYVENDHVTPN
jgi:hypothetical protein